MGQMRIVLISALAVILIGGSAYAVREYVTGPSGPELPDTLPGYGQAVAGADGGCGGGCCGGGGSAGGPARFGAEQGQGPDLEAMSAQVVRLYVENFGGKDVTAEVQDFGCHFEAYVSEGGAVRRAFRIQGDQMYEIPL